MGLTIRDQVEAPRDRLQDTRGAPAGAVALGLAQLGVGALARGGAPAGSGA